MKRLTTLSMTILIMLYSLVAIAKPTIDPKAMGQLTEDKNIYELSIHFARASTETQSELANDKFIKALENKGWDIQSHQYSPDNKHQHLNTFKLCPDSLLKNQYYVFIQGRGELMIHHKKTQVNIIAFRGSKVKQNWLFSDLQLQTTPLYQPLINPEDLDNTIHVHCGFNEYVYEASTDPSNALTQFSKEARANSNNPNEVYIVTGHSLGGAAATVFSSALYGQNQAMKNSNNFYLVTFGQPAVGKIKYKKHYEKTFKHYLRILNQGDLIPNATSLVGYQHIGKQIICKSREYCHYTKKSILSIPKRECDPEGGLHSSKEYQAIVDGLMLKGKIYANTHNCIISHDDAPAS